MNGVAAVTISDECYRCGYDLRGIENIQPCPECGLLADRSRRVTDEFHNSRPRWLFSLSRGVRLILLALLLAVGWLLVAEPARRMAQLTWPDFFSYSNRGSIAAYVDRNWPLLGADMGSVLFVLGAVLMTRREGFAPADQADRVRRWALRVMSVVPLLSLVYLHYWIAQTWSLLRYSPYQNPPLWVSGTISLLTCAPFPLLLFLQLRSLAKRARSAHLAEHCAIVGIGASLVFAFAAAVVVVFAHAETWGFRPYWINTSASALLLLASMFTGIALFILWSLYLLVRFTIAFRAAAIRLRGTWARDDRAKDAQNVVA